MLERIVDIATADGAMNTFVVQPDARQEWPLILLLMDAPGIRDELYAMGRRLAAAGYAVAVPNLYYRTTREGPQTDRMAMYQHMNSVQPASCCRDLDSLVSWCEGVAGISTSALGCVGYCMSGPLAIAAAAHFGEQMTAAASIHGVRLCHQGAGSAHRVLGAVRAQLYVGCAEHDAWASPTVVAAFARALQLHGVQGQVQWYPGARHGFVFPERSAVYQPAGAELHWQKLFELFAQQLPKHGQIA
ncbi:MAG: dienelactone hydrolase family protein [Pseudomonadales bacterium]